tara:strand:+ start:490 stop:1353 length:864 start_codon:yes stop_codon:yes gene_type:complete
MGIFRNNISKNEKMLYRRDEPKDLHWKPPGVFMGEIYDTYNDKYYSQRAGKKYKISNGEQHLDEGHYQGYRFVIQTLTKRGDIVLDPTVGSGTAIIEAINNGRKGLGVELEWPKLCEDNCKYQESDSYYKVYNGNAFDILNLIEKKYYGKVSLIVNGTPYPIINGDVTSDSPFGSKIKGYQHSNSFGNLKYPKGDYEYSIRDMYKKTDAYLKKNGYFCLIIKDPIRHKKPFLLQKRLIEWVMEDCNYRPFGYFIHKHIPETLFMRTYTKRYPEVVLPKYQIGCILKK